VSSSACTRPSAFNVWDRDDLAKGPIFETAVGNPPQPFVGAPSWSARLGLLFDAGAKVLLPEQSPSGGVSAFRVGAGCLFQPSWRTAFGRGTEPPPLVLGDALSRSAASAVATPSSTPAPAGSSGRSPRTGRRSPRRSSSETSSAPPTMTASCGSSARPA
jgi:hypothetical protein